MYLLQKTELSDKAISKAIRNAVEAKMKMFR